MNQKSEIEPDMNTQMHLLDAGIHLRHFYSVTSLFKGVHINTHLGVIVCNQERRKVKKMFPGNVVCHGQTFTNVLPKVIKLSSKL